MPDKARSPISGGSPSPARWAAAGVVGGASIVGMLWSIVGRAPAPIQPAVQPIMQAAQPSPPAVIERVTRATPEPAVVKSRPATPEANRSLESAEIRPDPAWVPLPRSDPRPQRSVASAVLTDRLDINRASQAELELLPRVGPTLAGRIIVFRNEEGSIRSLTHLTDVDGIGVRTAEAIAPYIRFD